MPAFVPAGRIGHYVLAWAGLRVEPAGVAGVVIATGRVIEQLRRSWVPLRAGGMAYAGLD
jgi:hypothetical protein